MNDKQKHLRRCFCIAVRKLNTFIEKNKWKYNVLNERAVCYYTTKLEISYLNRYNYLSL